MPRLPLPAEEIKKLVVGEGLITPEKFDQSYEESERKGQSLIDVLVSEKIIGADYLSNMIAKALGVDLVDFNVVKLDPSVVKLLPEDVARQRQVIVFNRKRTECLIRR